MPEEWEKELKLKVFLGRREKGNIKQESVEFHKFLFRWSNSAAVHVSRIKHCCDCYMWRRSLCTKLVIAADVKLETEIKPITYIFCTFTTDRIVCINSYTVYSNFTNVYFVVFTLTPQKSVNELEIYCIYRQFCFCC